MSAEHYIGNELELFRHAHNWKGYYRNKLSAFIRGDVLEAGAGIGETTRHLYHRACSSWTCLEPDASLSGKILEKCTNGDLPGNIRVITGTTADLPAEGSFDTILYIDVIEHIEDDRSEVERACTLLRPGGHLIILVPAHQWLFSPFDTAIGHYRRYNRALLTRCIPGNMLQQHLFYLDSLGLLASVANKYFLKKKYPSEKEVKFWDGWIVPFSKITDPLIGYSTGKSLIGVWKKPV